MFRRDSVAARPGFPNMIEALESRRLFADVFEPNDSFAAASYIGSLGTTQSPLIDISPTGDEDYFRFTAAGTGNLLIRMNLSNAAGDLDLFLYNSTGILLASSQGTGDVEDVNFTIVVGQDYVVRVNGFQGAVNAYNLQFVGPAPGTGTIAPDRYEPNDSFASAAYLGPFLRLQHNDLTIHQSGNADYYRFIPGFDGLTHISISFSNASGDLDLLLFNSAQEFVEISAGGGNTEEILAMLDTGQEYYLVVQGFAGAVSPDYDLTFAICPTVANDSFGYQVQQQIRFDFDQNVAPSIDVNDLLVYNVTTDQVIPSSNFTVQSIVTGGGATSSAIWRATTPLPDGYYEATLNEPSIYNVLHTPLYAPLQAEFFVLGGDANRDQVVNIADLLILSNNWQQSPRTFGQGNFSYDPGGLVNQLDLAILAENWMRNPNGTVLAGAPMPSIFGIPPLPGGTLTPSVAEVDLTRRVPKRMWFRLADGLS